MWNELSTDLALASQVKDSPENGPIPAVVDLVHSGSIGEDLGFEQGDQLISINGIKPRDLIDYRLLIAEEKLLLEVSDQDGKIHYVSFEKEPDDGLGLEFTEALFDGLKQCNNRCPFCFIDQQPPGKRTTLYLKDDDYRLSFLYGSYLTLTNLSNSDWRRIEEQHLSPLFVSVHATDPKLRARLLKNPRAGNILKQLAWFSDRNLQIHAQIVVCPGINDGKALEQTLNDLAQYATGNWPAVLSVAVVPVGLTRFRPKEDKLIPVDPSYALGIINQIEELQLIFQKNLQTRFAWLSDEWYLIAGKPLPTRNSYEGLPQEGNGVGSIRAFLEDLERATYNLPPRIQNQKICSWVVGKLVKEALIPACRRINDVQGLKLHLYGLPSPYWGQEEVVTGLLTGQDLLEGLKGKELGDQLLIPSVMLQSNQMVFLDDMTLEELSNALDISIRIVDGAHEIVKAALDVSNDSLSSLKDRNFCAD